MKNVAFSIIELMVVVAIIAMLAAISVPAYRSYQSRVALGSVQPYVEKAVNSLKVYYMENGRFPATPYEARSYLVSPTEAADDPYVEYVAFYGPCAESNVSRFQVKFKDGLNIDGLTTNNWSFVYHVADNDDLIEFSCRKNSAMSAVTTPTSCDAGVVDACTGTATYNTYDTSIGAP